MGGVESRLYSSERFVAVPAKSGLPQKESMDRKLMESRSVTRGKVAGARGSEAGTVVLSSGFVPKTESLPRKSWALTHRLEELTIGRLCLGVSIGSGGLLLASVHQ